MLGEGLCLVDYFGQKCTSSFSKRRTQKDDFNESNNFRRVGER